MRKDLVLSIVLHAAVLAIALIGPRFDFGSEPEFPEVIRVSLAELPAPRQIAQAVAEQPKPSTPKKETVPIEPPKKKEPPKKQDRPVPQPEKTTSPAESESKVDETKADKPSEVSGTQGSPFAGATVDNTNFQYPYWFTQTFNKIHGNLRNTVSTDELLVCTIYFQVLKSGRVVNLRVEKSSGVEAFDDACLLAVERSAPFPPLPDEFVEEIIGITLPITNGM